jgi:hypothetical protein
MIFYLPSRSIHSVRLSDECIHIVVLLEVFCSKFSPLSTILQPYILHSTNIIPRMKMRLLFYLFDIDF